jgi:hypothetical protein
MNSDDEGYRSNKLYKAWEKKKEGQQYQRGKRVYEKGNEHDEQRIINLVKSIIRAGKTQCAKRRARTVERKMTGATKPRDIQAYPTFKTWEDLSEGGELDYTCHDEKQRTSQKGNPGDEEKLKDALLAVREKKSNHYQKSSIKTKDKKNVSGKNKNVGYCSTHGRLARAAATNVIATNIIDVARDSNKDATAGAAWMQTDTPTTNKDGTGNDDNVAEEGVILSIVDTEKGETAVTTVATMTATTGTALLLLGGGTVGATTTTSQVTSTGGGGK